MPTIGFYHLRGSTEVANAGDFNFSLGPRIATLFLLHHFQLTRSKVEKCRNQRIGLVFLTWLETDRFGVEFVETIRE